MAKVRESAVSYLPQCALPRRNILFTVVGSTDVQTSLRCPLAISCLITPEMRQMVRGTGDPY